MELIDSHTHLDAPEFDGDIDGVIDRAVAVGVTRLVTIGAGYGTESAHRAVVIAERHSNVWASVGVHPHDTELQFNLSELRALAGHPRVVAIGETGLDLFRERASREVQYGAFRRQIELALEVKKPLIIHSREAGEECLKILNEYPVSSIGGVFHCFAENADFASQLRKINFLVSFPGNITFKNAVVVKQAARDVPLEQIMVETDAPFLAPEPHRGKRCESAFMRHTISALAVLKGVAVEEAARITTDNAKRFFGIN